MQQMPPAPGLVPLPIGCLAEHGRLLLYVALITSMTRKGSEREGRCSTRSR